MRLQELDTACDRLSSLSTVHRSECQDGLTDRQSLLVSIRDTGVFASQRVQSKKVVIVCNENPDLASGVLELFAVRGPNQSGLT
jgi:hypothetical protein